MWEADSLDYSDPVNSNAVWSAINSWRDNQP